MCVRYQVQISTLSIAGCSKMNIASKLGATPSLLRQTGKSIRSWTAVLHAAEDDSPPLGTCRYSALCFGSLNDYKYKRNPLQDGNQHPCSSFGQRFQSTTAESAALLETSTVDPDGPIGALFAAGAKDVGLSLIGQSGTVRRTFGPRSNADAMLTCGGEALAAHASFDPDYRRAQGWIRHHAVGPAVLSPVLISGLVGALVEAAFPQSVPDSQSMKVLRPLIVGVEVQAKIVVADVVPSAGEERGGERRQGYTVHLKTAVTRVRDDLVLAEGGHSIWIPDYLRM